MEEKWNVKIVFTFSFLGMELHIQSHLAIGAGRTIQRKVFGPDSDYDRLTMNCWEIYTI